MVFSCNVLLVEDDPLHVEIIREIIRTNFTNVTLHVCKSTACVEQKIKTNIFDLVIVDLILGHRDSSYDVLEKIVKAGGTQMIVMSALTSDADVSKARQFGIDVYVQKPLNIPAFISLLNSMLVDTGNKEITNVTDNKVGD